MHDFFHRQKKREEIGKGLQARPVPPHGLENRRLSLYGIRRDFDGEDGEYGDMDM